MHKGVNVLAKNENKKGDNHAKDNRKKESAIVTKESICSTCALFSFLALLILCSRSLIFGKVGEAIHIFLTGVFGYLAYAVILGALYLSVMGLLGKRLVKKRKAGVCIALCLVCIALIVHTAYTYSWALDGYLKKCFKAGETFPKTTPFGWLGGVVVFTIAKLITPIGTLVLFSSLAAFFAYLCYIMLRNREEKPIKAKVEKAPKEKKAKKEKAPKKEEGNAPYAPPLEGGQVNPYATPTMSQKPGVSLNDGTLSSAQGFSPFGVPTANDVLPSAQSQQSTYDSREVLFGGSPAENYRKNLLFDPTAKVNHRPNVEPSTATVQSEYTPSYTEAFETSVNNDAQIRPTKVVNDRSFGGVEERANRHETSVPTPVVEPKEEPFFREEPAAWQTPTFEREPASTRETFLEEEKSVTRGEEPRSEGGYKRHDYMDLFSPSNPNVFGNEESSSRAGREFADRALSRGRDFVEESEERESRDGLRIFDEEEEDPYTLRSDYEPSRAESTEDETLSRSRDFEDAESVREPSETRGRFVEEPPVVESRVELPKPQAPISKPRVIRPYVRPRLDDFDCRDIEPTSNQDEVAMTKESIIATLEDFKISGASIASVTFGPTVTRYNVTIPRNISPKKVVALDQSIAIDLHSNGVNIYPNYEDGVVSIEVPNKERQFVQLGCMLSGDTFVNAKSSSIMFAMGKDVANRKIYGDITKMIHLLVAGSSGSGKSVFLGSLIISLIYKYSPEELRLILIDPKKTEFVLYNNLPHLMINEIITDAGKAVQSLNWAIGEMNRRYSLFEQMSRAGTYVVNLDQYNEQLEKAERLPKIVIIIDELADLMLAAKKEMEDRIQNLTQKARAAGIHLIVATQRPSTDVITGVIKSNLPTRVAFYVATDVDSRVILDQTGAQKLLGKGDFLYTMPGINVPVRVQSNFISPEDSQKIVNFIKNNNEAYYDEEATAYINSRGGNGGDPFESGGGGSDGGVDPMYIDALRYVIQSNSASISMIQRKCSAGYNRAGKIIEWMEDMGYISPFDGAKARKVLITKEEFESKYGPL